MSLRLSVNLFFRVREKFMGASLYRLVIVFAIVVPAFTFNGSGQPACAAESGYHAIVLLQDPLIQKELSLSDIQKVSLRQQSEECVREFVAVSKNKKVTDEAPSNVEEYAPAPVLNLHADVLNRYNKSCLDGLEESQKTRLGQIAFQLRGADNLFDKHLWESLGLIPEQITKMLAIKKRLAELGRELQHDLGAKKIVARDYRRRVRDAYKEALKEGLEELVSIQRESYEQLAGPPVSFWRYDIKLELGDSNPKTRD